MAVGAVNAATLFQLSNLQTHGDPVCLFACFSFLILIFISYLWLFQYSPFLVPDLAIFFLF